MATTKKTNASEKSPAEFVKRLRQGLATDSTLRWNQRDVINTVIDFLNAHKGATVTEHDSKGSEDERISVKKGDFNAALIESSPGSGKTRMMGFVAKKAAHLNGADPNHKSTDAVKVLLLTPRLDLNRQTLREFDEELGIKDKDVALYDGNQNTAEKNRAKDTPVLIATYQSLPTMLQDGTISLDPASPQYRGLVLMDEVHELLDFKCKPKGSLQEATIASFINGHQTTLLFTGTDDGVSQRHFKGQVPTIYSKRLVKAHNQGLTCDPIHPGLVDVSVKEEPELGTSKKKDRSKEIVDYFGSHPKVIEAAVDTQLTAEHPHMGPLRRYKSLFFVNGVEAGSRGKDYFNKKAKELELINPKTGAYLKAAHIHAGTRKEERKQIIQDYKDGKIAAIFNDGILTFGFDDREAAIVHNLKMHDRDTGARALAQMEQIFTRGTRVCDGFKKKIALDGKSYDVDKQALLLTYRPLDQHGRPLNVLTSADLLAGLTLAAKAGKPWHRRGEDDQKRKRERKTLSDDFEVQVHFDFDEQAAIAQAMQGEYEKGQATSREKNWLTAPKFALITERSNHIERVFFNSIVEKFDASPDLQAITEFGELIPRAAVKTVPGSQGKVILLDNSDGLADRLGTKIKQAKDNWLSSSQFAEITGRHQRTEWRFFISLKERFDASPDLQAITEFGESIPRAAIKTVSGSGGRITVLDNSDGLADRLGKKIKQNKDNWLSAPQFAEITERHERTEQRFFASLMEKFDGSPDLQAITEFGESIPRAAIKTVTGQGAGGKVTLLDNSDGLADRLGKKIKQVKDNWLSSFQFAKITGRDKRTERIFLNSLLERFEASPNLQEIIEFNEPIPRSAIKSVSGKGRSEKITLIDNSDGLADRLGERIKQRDHWLSATQFAEVTGRNVSTEYKFLKSLLERFEVSPNLQKIIEFDEPIPRSAIKSISGKGATGKVTVLDNSDGLADRLGKKIKAQIQESKGHRIPEPCSTHSEHLADADKRKQSSIFPKVSNAPDNWASVAETKELPSGKDPRVRTTIISVIARYNRETGGVQSIPHEGESIRVQKIQKGQDQQPVCIYREDWEKVLKVAGIDAPAADRFKATPIAKKGIDPSSDDLKRTGRARDK